MNKDEIKKAYDAIPEEQKEILRRKSKRLSEILPIVLIAKAQKDLVSIMRLGDASEKYCEEFKCSPLEFIQDLQTMEQVFMEKSIQNLGVCFDEKFHRVPKNLKKKNRENSEAIKKESGYKPFANLKNIGDKQ